MFERPLVFLLDKPPYYFNGCSKLVIYEWLNVSPSDTQKPYPTLYSVTWAWITSTPFNTVGVETILLYFHTLQTKNLLRNLCLCVYYTYIIQELQKCQKFWVETYISRCSLQDYLSDSARYVPRYLPCCCSEGAARCGSKVNEGGGQQPLGQYFSGAGFFIQDPLESAWETTIWA